MLQTAPRPHPAVSAGPGASCDLLVELVDTLRQIDALTAKATWLVERAQRTGEVEDATGLPLELWLSGAARRTRADRRMLSTTAELRSKMPVLADAFDAGTVSWSQVRAIVCAVAKLPGHVVRQVDDALADEVVALAEAEPDDLVHVVSRTLNRLDPTDEVGEVARSVDERFLAIQPRLDGTGGRIYGDADAYSLAVLTEALDAGSPPPRRLRDHVGEGVDAERLGNHRASEARRRMDALVAMAERSLARGDQPGGVSGPRPGVAGPDGGRATAPTLLITMSYETLIGASDAPAGLLTRLTGGRMKMAAETARRLADNAGAHLRTIVLEDTGSVLGVGRRSYQAPGWMRDAALVRDVTCTTPGCSTSARLCDLDHGEPWSPPPDRATGGTTDLVNLAHICRTDHTARTRDGWLVSGQPDGNRSGLRRWLHRRSGMVIDTVPATRQLTLQAAARGDPDP